jgi:hypothetical protein
VKLLKKVNDKSDVLNIKADDTIKKLSDICDQLKEIREIVSRLPERKEGWLGGYWDNSKK